MRCIDFTRVDLIIFLRAIFHSCKMIRPCLFQKWDGTEVAYQRELPCRYVTGYDYRTALILSVFMGMFGIDRFYLGYLFTQFSLKSENDFLVSAIRAIARNLFQFSLHWRN